MSNPTGKEVALLAETLADGNRIPYVYGHEKLTSADCQGFIEAVVRKLGGSMSYRGSNDMYRNACTIIVPIAQARAENMMMPGGLLFILKNDGKEKDRGYLDGLGNASHVGFYTGVRYYSVHSSSAQNDVIGSDETYPWTHYGYAKSIDYQIAPIPENGLTGIVSRLGDILRDLKSYANIN